MAKGGSEPVDAGQERQEVAGEYRRAVHRILRIQTTPTTTSWRLVESRVRGDAHARFGGRVVMPTMVTHGAHHGARLAVIAVGTVLAGGPPHRSQRALLTHWAPALGTNAEARVGKGMHHAGGR